MKIYEMWPLYTILMAMHLIKKKHYTIYKNLLKSLKKLLILQEKIPMYKIFFIEPSLKH